MALTDDAQRAVDPVVLLTLGRLENRSRSLLALARRDDVSRDDAIRAFEQRAELDGHLLAARVLLASGASHDSVRAVLARAERVTISPPV